MGTALTILAYVSLAVSCFALGLCAYVLVVEKVSKDLESISFTYDDEEECKEDDKLDTTSGIRLLSFLQREFEEMEDGDGVESIHPLLQEEFEFLCSCCCQLVKISYGNPDNSWYFKNLVSDNRCWQDVVRKRFKPEFVEYLTRIHAI